MKEVEHVAAEELVETKPERRVIEPVSMCLFAVEEEVVKIL